MEVKCVRQDCTVADTGTCLLSNDPSSCPHQVTTDNNEARTNSEIDLPTMVRFSSSRACMLNDARELMAERYVHLVGVLGEPNAGKTGCLVSLYLSAGQRCLHGLTFAESRTHMGFEEISQGARRWNKGNIPEQFTDHTVLQDDRKAGFLHIRLARDQRRKPVDLLCSDLPGEWTTQLVDKNRVDRLKFLERADVIWLVVDGTETVTTNKRQVCLKRTKLAIGRLGNFLAHGRRLIVVMTRLDEKTPDNGVVEEICAEGFRYGFDTKSLSVASFSTNSLVSPGKGIKELIELSTNFDRSPDAVWQQDGRTNSFDLPHIGLVRRILHDG